MEMMPQAIIETFDDPPRRPRVSEEAVRRRARRRYAKDPSTLAEDAKAEGVELRSAEDIDDVASSTLERIIGSNEMLPVSFLEQGMIAARAVGKVEVGGPTEKTGTGFLVSSRLFMTNHHVLADAAAASSSLVQFGFEVDAAQMVKRPLAIGFDPATFFVTGTEGDVDYTLVALRAEDAPEDVMRSLGHLRLIADLGKATPGVDFLNLVHHPGGQRKRISIRENRLVEEDDAHLYYEGDTLPGSSGAPLFNDQWEVVGIHFDAVPRTDADGRPLTREGQVWDSQTMDPAERAFIHNKGLRMSRLINDLRTRELDAPAAALRAEIAG